jgi:hypothetical protein
MNDEEYRKQAQTYEIDGTPVDVDEGAVVSRGSDPGAYVQAWVWVPSDDGKPSLSHRRYNVTEYGDTEAVILQAERLLIESAGGASDVDSDIAIQLACAVLEEMSDGTATCVECACLVPAPLKEGLCEHCYTARHDEEREREQFSPLRSGDL